MVVPESLYFLSAPFSMVKSLSAVAALTPSGIIPITR